jgi:hypothetical protein
MIVVVGSAVLLSQAHTQQTTLEKYGFSTCNDRLCFLGIAPGVTRWSKALDILVDHGAVQPNLSENVFFMGHTRIRIDYDPQTQVVGYISVIGQSGVPLPVTAGDAIRYLGVPCGFTPITFQLNTMVLYYPHGSLTFNLEGLHLYPTTQINYVDLPASDGYCDRATVWPGFASYDHYLTVLLKALN